MMGILVSFWDGLFSGAMLVLGSVYHPQKFIYLLLKLQPMAHLLAKMTIPGRYASASWLKNLRSSQNLQTFHDGGPLR